MAAKVILWVVKRSLVICANQHISPSDRKPTPHFTITEVDKLATHTA
ncbi:hypothetical protein [Nostoc sp.]